MKGDSSYDERDNSLIHIRFRFVFFAVVIAFVRSVRVSAGWPFPISPMLHFALDVHECASTRERVRVREKFAENASNDGTDYNVLVKYKNYVYLYNVVIDATI